MNDALTIDYLLDLPKELLTLSRANEEYTAMLRRDIYSQFNIRELKQIIKVYFDKYEDTKYYVNVFSKYNVTISSLNFDLKENQKTNNTKDKVSTLVSNKLDDEIWIKQFYNALMIIGRKLTEQEAIYFVDTFFGKKSEDLISNKLGVCRTTLQNIKKSCLVKVYLELRSLEFN